jgi:hypothetical protein
MAITIYEYSNTADGLPVQPASIRRADEAFGEAHGFDDRTEYVAVIADADAYLRISLDGGVATSDDHKLLAGQSYGFLVKPAGGAQVYAISAA